PAGERRAPAATGSRAGVDRVAPALAGAAGRAAGFGAAGLAGAGRAAAGFCASLARSAFRRSSVPPLRGAAGSSGRFATVRAGIGAPAAASDVTGPIATTPPQALHFAASCWNEAGILYSAP